MVLMQSADLWNQSSEKSSKTTWAGCQMEPFQFYEWDYISDSRSGSQGWTMFSCSPESCILGRWLAFFVVGWFVLGFFVGKVSLVLPFFSSCSFFFPPKYCFVFGTFHRQKFPFSWNVEKIQMGKQLLKKEQYHVVVVCRTVFTLQLHELLYLHPKAIVFDIQPKSCISVCTMIGLWRDAEWIV